MDEAVEKVLAAACVPYAQNADVYSMTSAEQAMYALAVPKAKVLVCLASPEETTECVALLKSENYNAEGLPNAQQTLDRAVEVVPDLIIVAMESSGVGKLSLCYQLQEVVKWPQHPSPSNGPAVLMITPPNQRDEGIWFPRIDYGPDMYLTRGVSKVEMLSFIRRLTGR